jgi:hypothetical protein
MLYSIYSITEGYLLCGILLIYQANKTEYLKNSRTEVHHIHDGLEC